MTSTTLGPRQHDACRVCPQIHAGHLGRQAGLVVDEEALVIEIGLGYVLVHIGSPLEPKSARSTTAT
jgi:hypothetical protein